jgi:hypothetical protein
MPPYTAPLATIAGLHLRVRTGNTLEGAAGVAVEFRGGEQQTLTSEEARLLAAVLVELSGQLDAAREKHDRWLRDTPRSHRQALAEEVARGGRGAGGA